MSTLINAPINAPIGSPSSFDTYPGESELRTSVATFASIDQDFQLAEKRIREFALRPNDWDDEGGVPPLANVITVAVAMLHETFTTFQIKSRAWIRPLSSLMNDGSISLYWELDDFRALVIIGPDEDDIRSIIRIDGETLRISVSRNDCLNLMESVSELVMQATR